MNTALTRMMLLAAALACAGCQKLFLAAVNVGDGAPPAPVQTHVYDQQRGLALDLYRPQGDGPHPMLVFFYGGSWKQGNREQYGFVAQALADAGLLVAVPDYRTWPEAGFPDFVEDGARAVAWLHRQAEALGADRARLHLAGHSAGAHIAAMLATDARYLAAEGLAPTDFASMIGIAGPYDFLPLTDPELQAIFGPKENWPASQPVNFVDGDEPPFLLLHGSDDRYVWTRNSRRLAERLRAAEVPVRLRVYDDVGHIRILSSLRFKALAPTRADLLDWIRRGPPAAPGAGDAGDQPLRIDGR